MSGSSEHRSGQIDDILPLVYDELRAIAMAYFKRQPRSFTLCPTEIVHEACMHLMRFGPTQWDSPQHFRAIATRKIWQIIIDHLKQRNAAKRGGGGLVKSPAAAATGDDIDAQPAGRIVARTPAAKRIPLDTVTVDWVDHRADVLDVAEALDALQRESARLHDVTLLHWFGGMTHEEVARVLDVSASTAEKDWRYAIAWLKRRLLEGAPHEH